MNSADPELQIERAEESTASPAETRRTFLGATGRKAAFILPAVWTLSAQQALAQGSSLSCSAYGTVCEVNEDCCTLNCHAPTMTCKGAL